MASCRMPEEFFEIVAHHLPPDEPVGPDGGRPPISNRTVMSVLWYVLATGCRWRDVPPQMGCCGETVRSRLRLWEAAGIWARLHVDLLGLLRRDGELEHDTAIVDAVLVQATDGGEAIDERLDGLEDIHPAFEVDADGGRAGRHG